jgi:hypothetical protein
MQYCIPTYIAAPIIWYPIYMARMVESFHSVLLIFKALSKKPININIICFATGILTKKKEKEIKENCIKRVLTTQVLVLYQKQFLKKISQYYQAIKTLGVPALLKAYR